MEFNGFTTALIVGIIQALYLISNLMLNGERRRRVSNRVLSLLLAAIIFSLLLRLGYNTSLFIRYPHLSIAGDFIMFLVGPLLYFYICCLLYHDLKFERKKWIHFIPLALFLASFIYTLKFSAHELLKANSAGGLHLYYFVILWGGAISLLVYTYMAYKEVILHGKRHLQTRSDFPRTSYLRFILGIVIGITSVWIISLITLQFSDNIVLSNYIYQVIFLLTVMLIFVMSYYAMNAPELFILNQDQSKYSHSMLNRNDLLDIKIKLELYFDTQRPYLDPELSLSDIAKEIDTNQSYLSRVINESYGKNFFDYVNEYRVKFFIDRVLSGSFDHLTYSGIAVDCGFGTKATFYRAFKKLTSRTPKKYFSEIEEYSQA